MTRSTIECTLMAASILAAGLSMPTKPPQSLLERLNAKARATITERGSDYAELIDYFDSFDAVRLSTDHPNPYSEVRLYRVDGKLEVLLITPKGCRIYKDWGKPSGVWE